MKCFQAKRNVLTARRTLSFFMPTYFGYHIFGCYKNREIPCLATRLSACPWPWFFTRKGFSISRCVRPSSGTHRASCLRGTRSLPALSSGQGVQLITCLYPVPNATKDRSSASTPQYVVSSVLHNYYAEHTLTFICS